MDISSKKSRIAIVISVLWIIVASLVVAENSCCGMDADDFTLLFFFTLPVTAYWAWKWISSGK